MKTTCLLAFVFLLALESQAQKADSLEKVLQKTKSDTSKTLLLSLLADELTKSDPLRSTQTARTGLALAKAIKFPKGIVENYHSLATTFQGQSLFDSSVRYFHHALTEAATNNDALAQAEACSGLGHSFMRKSEMDSARFYLDKGLKLAQRAHNYRVEAGIYNNYGNVFLEESNYQKALDYFIQAARLYENPLHDAYGQCLVLGNIGNIEYRLANYSKALNYANQSMAIAKRKDFTSSIHYAHKLLGRIYRKQKKYEAALKEYKQAQQLCLVLGDVRSAAEILQNIGNIYFDKAQYRDALENYSLSLKNAKQIRNKPLIASAYSCIGQAHMALHNNDSAVRYLDSCRVTAQALGSKYLVMDVYGTMSEIYETQGDYKKSLAMHQKYVQLKDSITRNENRTLSEETQAKYELEKKQAQIALLEKDAELKTLAIEQHRAIQIGAAGGFVLLIIIALLLINRFRISNQVKRLAEIEAVRNAIARDLHDDIGSTLSSINISSKLAIRQNPEGNNLHLTRIAEQSSQIMESMTDMVWSINPLNDDFEKVLVKMKVFTSEILEPKNISFRFLGEESLKGISLNAGKRKNLFLIFKEALNNAAKYSEATEVEISLKQLEKKLLLTISDNGQGFDFQTIKKGNGLTNMAERAKALFAQFRMTSHLNKGTRIELEMPIT